MTTRREIMEDAHKELAQASGELAGMLARGKMSLSILRRARDGALLAARKLDALDKGVDG